MRSLVNKYWSTLNPQSPVHADKIIENPWWVAWLHHGYPKQPRGSHSQVVMWHVNVPKCKVQPRVRFRCSLWDGSVVADDGIPWIHFRDEKLGTSPWLVVLAEPILKNMNSTMGLGFSFFFDVKNMSSSMGLGLSMIIPFFWWKI